MELSKQDRLELEALRAVFQETSPYVGEAFIQALVRGLGQLLKAKSTFVAYVLDDPPTRVRGIAGWREGTLKESWEYNLAGNPCLLTYSGKPTFIPCSLADQFPQKKDTGYQSYIGVPLFDDDGKVIGHVAVYAVEERPLDDYAKEIVQLCAFRAEAEVRRILEDREVRRRIERLMENDKRKTEAIQVITHELRTPLSSVIGFLQMIEQETIANPVSEYVSSALDGAERLMHFINQELDLEKIEQGSSARRNEPVNLAEVITASVERLKPVAAPWDITIRFESRSSPPLILGDNDHLGRLMDNLIANAVKYSPQGGSVSVTMARNGDNAELAVADEGPGIPKSLQPIIFDKFSRAPSDNTRQRGGAGLGLSIVKAITESHGGEVNFTTSDAGTRFKVVLPGSD